MSVFVIDDDIFYTSIIEHQLENIEVSSIHVFEDLTQIYQNIQRLSPRVIFLDLNLENTFSMPFIEQIKIKFPNIYLVAMSASNDEKIAKECYQKGAFYYLNKNRNIQENIQNIFKEVNKYKEHFY